MALEQVLTLLFLSKSRGNKRYDSLCFYMPMVISVIFLF